VCNIMGKSKKGDSGKRKNGDASGSVSGKKGEKAGTGATGATTNDNNLDINKYTVPPEEKPDSAVRLVILSDTHGKASDVKDLPKGDILVFCGDFSLKGTLDELKTFVNDFLRTNLPKFQHVILIAGNHDEMLDPESTDQITNDKSMEILSSLGEKCIYLEDESVTLMGIKFFGSPW